MMRATWRVVLVVLAVLATGAAVSLARAPGSELTPALSEIGEPSELVPTGGAWRFDQPIVFLPDAVAALHGRAPAPVDQTIDPGENVTVLDGLRAEAARSAPAKPSFAAPGAAALPAPGAGAAAAAPARPDAAALRGALADLHRRLGL